MPLFVIEPCNWRNIIYFHILYDIYFCQKLNKRILNKLISTYINANAYFACATYFIWYTNKLSSIYYTFIITTIYLFVHKPYPDLSSLRRWWLNSLLRNRNFICLGSMILHQLLLKYKHLMSFSWNSNSYVSRFFNIFLILSCISFHSVSSLAVV